MSSLLQWHRFPLILSHIEATVHTKALILSILHLVLVQILSLESGKLQFPESVSAMCSRKSTHVDWSRRASSRMTIYRIMSVLSIVLHHFYTVTSTKPLPTKITNCRHGIKSLSPTITTSVVLVIHPRFESLAHKWRNHGSWRTPGVGSFVVERCKCSSRVVCPGKSVSTEQTKLKIPDTPLPREPTVSSTLSSMLCDSRPWQQHRHRPWEWSDIPVRVPPSAQRARPRSGCNLVPAPPAATATGSDHLSRSTSYDIFHYHHLHNYESLMLLLTYILILISQSTNLISPSISLSRWVQDNTATVGSVRSSSNFLFTGIMSLALYEGTSTRSQHIQLISLFYHACITHLKHHFLIFYPVFHSFSLFRWCLPLAPRAAAATEGSHWTHGDCYLRQRTSQRDRCSRTQW